LDKKLYPLLETNRQALDSWMKMNETIASCLGELSAEMLRFAQHRFQADVETNLALARCHNPEDVFECQVRCTERATAQYRETTSKLADIMGRLASAGMMSVQGLAREGKHGVGGKKP